MIAMLHPRLSGTYVEMGRRYGRGLRRHGFTAPEASSEALALTRRCESEVDRIFPDILEEIAGLAEGCRVDYDRLAAFLLRIGVSEPGAGCSAFAASSGPDVIFGRNYDFFTRFRKYTESYLTIPRGEYASVGHSDIFVGREDGVNERGLAVALSFVEPTEIVPGVAFPILVRCVLDTCATVPDAVESLRRARHATARNYLLADRSGAMAVVEGAAGRVRVRRPKGDAGHIVATNHFVHPEMLDLEDVQKRDADSLERYDAIHGAIEARDGKVDEKTAQAILSDHLGSVCSHHDEIELGTLWSLVASLKRLRVVRSEGNPCATPYKADPRLRLAADAAARRRAS